MQALQQEGRYVAMIGEGVNDVLALKQGNLGVAMQSGSQATRSVAEMVLRFVWRARLFECYLGVDDL